MSRSSFLLNLL